MKQRKIEKTVEQIMHQIANEPNLYVSIEPVIDPSRTRNQLAVFVNSPIYWSKKPGLDFVTIGDPSEVRNFFGAPAESLEFCYARNKFYIPLQYFPEDFEAALNLHKQLSPCH